MRRERTGVVLTTVTVHPIIRQIINRDRGRGTCVTEQQKQAHCRPIDLRHTFRTRSTGASGVAVFEFDDGELVPALFVADTRNW